MLKSNSFILFTVGQKSFIVHIYMEASRFVVHYNHNNTKYIYIFCIVENSAFYAEKLTFY